MSEGKTRPTAASVDAYLVSRANAAQLADCRSLIQILQRVTGEPPKMWGPSIVGFGSYRYPLASGKTGEACATGFAIRGRDLVVYLMTESPSQHALLRELGKHKLGKACLYFRRLADLDTRVLEQLIAASVAEVRRRYDEPHG